jgi:hypothetical protein
MLSMGVLSYFGSKGIRFASGLDTPLRYGLRLVDEQCVGALRAMVPDEETALPWDLSCVL